MLDQEHVFSLPAMFTAGATGITALFGGWDNVFQVFVICMVLDMITGVIKGFVMRDFSSRRMREGFVTKFGYIIVIVLATQFDRLMPQDMPLLRTIALWFYIFVESSSIVENLAQIGVPIPQAIVDRLSALKVKSGDYAKIGEDGKFVTTTETSVTSTTTDSTTETTTTTDEHRG